MNVAFLHKEIEVKKNLLKLAQDCTSKSSDTENGIANKLAGALLYANIADYLAMHLNESLESLVDEATKKYYLGDLGFKRRKRGGSEYTLGALIGSLEMYSFENKDEIIQAFKDVNHARIPVIHHIAKTPGKKLGMIDDSTEKLAESTERLIGLIDELYVNQMPRKNLLDFFTANKPDKA